MWSCAYLTCCASAGVDKRACAHVCARTFGTACAYDLGKDSSLENEIEEISMVRSAFD